MFMKYKNILISLIIGFLVCFSFIKFLHGDVFASTVNPDKIFSISGTIDFGNDTGKLSPVFSYNSTVLNDLKRGEYSVELLGRGDSMLFKQDFQPAQIVAQYNVPKQSLYTKILSFLCRISLLNRFNITCPYVDSALGTGGFVFKLPYIDSTTTIRLKHGSKILDQLQPGSNFPSIKINPIATRQLPTAGEFKFSWSANDIDNDKLYYLVLISNDNQKTWKTISSGVPYPQLSYDVSRIPKSDGIFFQVLASDGINTSSDIVGPFSASAKMPMAQIINPKDGDSIQQGYPIILLGSGNSPEEENTIPDERLTWSSDISGILGNGQTLQVEKPLPKGKHTITLSVIDKYGNKSSASINLTIK